MQPKNSAFLSPYTPFSFVSLEIYADAPTNVFLATVTDDLRMEPVPRMALSITLQKVPTYDCGEK